MARSSQGFSGNRHTFLNPERLEEGSRLLLPPGKAPSGETSEKLRWSHCEVSSFLSDEILSVFRKHPLWQKAHPILLGSWGRGELTPKSDLDLLMIGEPEFVFSLVTDLQSQGYRIRYRIPEDPERWWVGVESADWLSLWKARAETETAREKLLEQQQLIFSQKEIRKKILKDLLIERKKRAERFDSIESFLEPQIKFGAGGLRDLFQGLVILHLFPDCFEEAGHERELLGYYQDFFLTIRQKLHFDGYSDVLAASEQFELARWFGYEQNSEFMRQVQRGLARSHFYSQWILEKAQASLLKKTSSSPAAFKKPESLLRALQKDSSILSQYRVRSQIDRFKYPAAVRGRMLGQIFSQQTRDQTLQAVFRSRLIDKICPRILHLVGLVQHDQYHRFTADAHLLQACREVKKIQAKPRELGALKPLLKKLKRADWKILSWTALYHDLAKGLPGDHSEVGELWVEKDLKSFGLKAAFRKEVAWLVRNHLELSIAAFRKNPNSPETWQSLQNLDLNEKRLVRLAVWTALDIRATNPEAWNEWKSKLLMSLTEKLLAGPTQNFLKLKKHLPLGLSSEVVDSLDPQLFENFRAETLQKDLKAALGASEAWAVTRDLHKKLWIRFHQSQDRPGLLSECLEKIYASGASIQHALVHTLPEIGVYDWFQVQTQKDASQLLKLLQQLKSSNLQPPKVHLMSIDWISRSETEWVLSFRGLDQKGLLLGAALALKEAGAEITSARVHTWGRQIEDLFHIKPLEISPEEFLGALKSRLMS